MTRRPLRLPRPARPHHLANTPRPRNDIACLGIRNQRLLQRGVLVVREVLEHQLGKEFRLDERHQGPKYTSLT